MNFKALHKNRYGLHVVTSRKKYDFNGQIANTILQIISKSAAIAAPAYIKEARRR